MNAASSRAARTVPLANSLKTQARAGNRKAKRSPGKTRRPDRANKVTQNALTRMIKPEAAKGAVVKSVKAADPQSLHA